MENERVFDEEEDRAGDIEVPFDPSKIDIIQKPMAIGSLHERLKNKELDLTPDFQRHANLWNNKRKSRLIESVLLRIPLPSFYFSEDGNGTYAVVDGLQRLCTIFHFLDPTELNKKTNAKLNALRLSDLQYLKELDGVAFVELERKFQRRITELEISANIIRAGTPSAVKFNVFARLNQGGMPLNAQEIRNAIFFMGDWRNRLNRLANSGEFLHATQKKIPTDRQQDVELILRFIALWQIGREASYKRPINQTLDEFLNEVVETQLTSWSPQKWEKVEKVFLLAIKTAHAVFGKHVFKKSNASSERATPINKGLFESQLIAFADLTDREIDKVKERKEKVVNHFSKAIEGTDFKNALSYNTGSGESSNIRIKKLREIISGVLHD